MTGLIEGIGQLDDFMANPLGHVQKTRDERYLIHPAHRSSRRTSIQCGDETQEWTRKAICTDDPRAAGAYAEQLLVERLQRMWRSTGRYQGY